PGGSVFTRPRGARAPIHPAFSVSSLTDEAHSGQRRDRARRALGTNRRARVNQNEVEGVEILVHRGDPTDPRRVDPSPRLSAYNAFSDNDFDEDAPGGGRDGPD